MYDIEICFYVYQFHSYNQNFIKEKPRDYFGNVPTRNGALKYLLPIQTFEAHYFSETSVCIA